MVKHNCLVICVVIILFSVRARADITIGLAGPMTGSVAAFGEQMQNGAQAAVAMINANGGINGEKLKLIIEDDVCDPKQAVEVANRLISKHVVAVIGHWCSAASMSASSVYESAEMLMLDPGSLRADMTRQGFKNIFRMSTTEIGVATRAAIYIKTLPVKHIVMATDTRSITHNISNALMTDMKANGIMSDNFIYNAGEKDYQALVTKMLDRQPELVFISGYTQEAGLIVRSLRQSGFTGPIVGMDTMGAADFRNITGVASDGTVIVDYARPAQSAALTALQEKLRALHKPDDTYTLMTAAAVDILAATFKIGAKTASDIRVQLLHKTFATPVGDVSFAPNGDRINLHVGLYRWQADGTLVALP